MTAASDDTLPRVDRYEVVREIGHGGMAVVYLARQTDLQRDVALKELRLFDGSDPSAARRFVQESRVGAALTHPNVVTVHDYFEQDGAPYIAMEYLLRGSLRRYVGHTSTAENIGVLEGLLAGLDHAARHGVVHRDIKPENVMVTVEGHVKIADFGIAKATYPHDQGSLMTLSGVPVGTPSYMAPEQAVGDELGPWTDLYSAGIMAWELFVGHLPFRDTPSAVGLLLRSVNEAIPPAHSVEPSVDPEISAWIDSLLVKDPRDRARSASEAWDELEEIASRTLGSCWRREARLREPAGTVSVESPLTPAPFAVSEDAGEAAPVAAVPRPPDEATTDEIFFTDRGTRASADTRDGSQALVPVRTPVHRPSPVPAPPPAPTPARADALRATARTWAGTAAARVGPRVTAARLGVRNGAARITPRLADVRVAPRAAAVAALTAIAVIVGGWLAGGAGGRAAGPVVLEGAGVRIAVPQAWTRLPAAPAIPGVTHAGAVSAGPDASGGTGVEASVVTYHPPSLLARDTLDAVEGRLPAPTAVRLANGDQAFRYDGLRLAGRPGLVTIYAVPTTDWVATLACFAPSALAPRFATACATVAATRRPTGARAVTVGPSPAFGDRVARVLADLRVDTAAPQRRLVGAATARDQVAAARRLAHAYGDAAGVLDNLPDRVVDGIAIGGLSSGLSEAAGAYEQLAAAAGAGRPADYDRAKDALDAARGAIRDGRLTLTRAGYGTR